ncbi:MAG: GTP-binding protein [Promethearchaeota archaeon]|nr:MAG: GTP-binding protein [Candidatus Lokiarchaeota archaeon]
MTGIIKHMVEPDQSRKILLMGLDNSGKTSIVYSLKGIRNLPTYSKVNPTIGENVEYIEMFDSRFGIWDLGGQENYRRGYLKDLERITSGCDKLIYVFDIQDVKRYDLALDYYEKVIDFLDDVDNKSNIEISIFLHKNDPDLIEIKPNLNPEMIEDLKERIKQKIEPTGLVYKIFKTTIYATFEKSITD